MLLLTVIVFVVLLLALVLVHEWGHFITAKKAGCNVEEFGFGFPPRLASFTWHGTRYSLNLFPIGGFVKIEGENMDEQNPAPTSFASKSATWRSIILAAGVTMNVVLAWVLLSAQSIIGVPVLVTDENHGDLQNQLTYILEVTPNSPAADAGLTSLDRIVSVDGQTQPSITAIQKIAIEKAGQPMTIVADRQGTKHTLELTPRAQPPPNEGPLGISLAATGLTRLPWWQAPWHGLVRTGMMLYEIIRQFSLILWRLTTQGLIGDGLAGPVGIAVYTNEVTNLGLPYILEFAALISLNLALINILPIPALDGGRILFVIIEKLRGRRVASHVEKWSHTIGFVALILLMIAITFRDITRFFT